MSANSDLAIQEGLKVAWLRIVAEEGQETQQKVHVMDSIESAIKFIKLQSGEDEQSNTAVLACGSLHLVGGVLEVAGLPVS